MIAIVDKLTEAVAAIKPHDDAWVAQAKLAELKKYSPTRDRSGNAPKGQKTRNRKAAKAARKARKK
jgi:hypothetical protein